MPFTDSPEGQTHYCERCENKLNINLQHTCGIAADSGKISSKQEERLKLENEPCFCHGDPNCIDARPKECNHQYIAKFWKAIFTGDGAMLNNQAFEVTVAVCVKCKKQERV